MYSTQIGAAAHNVQIRKQDCPMHRWGNSVSGLKSDAQPLLMVSVSQRPYQYLTKGDDLGEP